jgi:dTDP-4-amino-4,6-dideoxygalactose transaminase
MVVARSAEVAERVRRLRNFGHNGEEEFSEFGTNGKNSELHAAMGLTILPYVDKILKQRRMQAETYHEVLFRAPLRLPPVSNPTWNCAYFPIVFEDEQCCIAVKTQLAERGILTRRYFYPSLNRIATDRPESCPRAESLSERILCLPMFHELTQKETATIGRLIASLSSSSFAQ